MAEQTVHYFNREVDKCINEYIDMYMLPWPLFCVASPPHVCTDLQGVGREVDPAVPGDL